jgi:hypothetical protein
MMSAGCFVDCLKGEHLLFEAFEIFVSYGIHHEDFESSPKERRQQHQ